MSPYLVQKKHVDYTYAMMEYLEEGTVSAVLTWVEDDLYVKDNCLYPIPNPNSGRAPHYNNLVLIFMLILIPIPTFIPALSGLGPASAGARGPGRAPEGLHLVLS